MKEYAKMMLLLLIFLGLAACTPRVPPPDSQIRLATAAISQAESVGAYKTAPVELRSARDKLSQAKQAIQMRKNLTAQRLAEEAYVDANLAQTKTRTAESRKAVEELKTSIRTLQEEINKNFVQ